MVENCKRLFLLIVIFCLSCGISLAASYSDINSISISNSYVTASLNDSMKIEATIKDRYYRNFSKSDVTSIMIAGNIWWESSNKNVVKIEGTDADNGKTIANIKCVGTGTATLRVLSSNRVTASCTINVKENNSPVIGSIRMEKSIENTTVNNTLTINAIIKDNKWNSISKDKIALLMKNGDIWFETSNSRVLSITSTDAKDGQCLAYVKGVSAGTATINVRITQGTGSDTFTPDELITREQMATMMTRAIEKAGIDTKVDLDNVSKFADDNEMHDWGRESIYYMSSIEVIKGVGDNTFSVLGNATREQSLLISVRNAENFNKFVK